MRCIHVITLISFNFIFDIWIIKSNFPIVIIVVLLLLLLFPLINIFAVIGSWVVMLVHIFSFYDLISICSLFSFCYHHWLVYTWNKLNLNKATDFFEKNFLLLSFKYYFDWIEMENLWHRNRESIEFWFVHTCRFVLLDLYQVIPWLVSLLFTTTLLLRFSFPLFRHWRVGHCGFIIPQMWCLNFHIQD